MSNRIITAAALAAAGLVVQTQAHSQVLATKVVALAATNNTAVIMQTSPATGVFPGQIAMKVVTNSNPLYDGGHYVTFHPNSDDNALITTAIGIGPNQRFTLDVETPGYKTLQVSTSALLAAISNATNNAYSMSTDFGAPAAETLFTFSRNPYQPPAFGGYKIGTYYGDEVNAVDNQTNGAFNTQTAIGTVNVAQTSYRIQHCGDLGSGYVYNITPYLDASGSNDALFGFAAINGGGVPSNAIRPWNGDPVATANFKLIKQADQVSYALQTSDGIHYVTAAVGGGVVEGDTLHTDATRVGSWEEFRLVDQGNCHFTIQAHDGNFLAYSSNYGFSTDFSAPPGDPLTYQGTYTPFFVLTPVL